LPSPEADKLLTIPAEVFELTHLETLNLMGNRIRSIPQEIKNLTNLRVLNLAYNEISFISREIDRLQNLNYLDIWAAKGTRLPYALSELRNLRWLGLVGFGLRAVPKWIPRLKQLQSLNLSSNELSRIPKWVSRLDQLNTLWLAVNQLDELPEDLAGLENLTSLGLTDNHLSELPPSVMRLEKLGILKLKRNRINAIPKNIDQLHNLTALDLSENNLESLPKTFADLKNLSSLDLGNNLLTMLPDCIYALPLLQKLSLNEPRYSRAPNKNRISKISPMILQLQNLMELEVGDNPIEVPPPEIVIKGIESIKEYFRQIEFQGTDHLYEAKLLVVGEPGAGKTSLAKKIENSGYQLCEEDSTRGIEVIRWKFPMEDGQPFTVNIWDFGGQEIYHATHQFFLTKRSLYVLVADTRKEDTDFYYWLNAVELLSEGSPLLIVKNEKQDRNREINERQLRGQFSNLKETLSTNLATNRGLEKILAEIKYQIAHLPQIGSPLPKTWVKVREALEKASRNYISLDEYLDICGRNGFSLTKDKLQLSGYLHDLGVCLHFQEDPLLKKTVILKPKWGTDAVYKVLDNKTVIGNLGKFDQGDLKSIWNEPEYAEMQDELLQLMINFKLCYRIPNSEFYIAPQLLTENQPQHEWDESNNLVVRYTYESFMPKGIITQLIVAMHKLIAEQRYVWRSGVILQKGETKAEIIEYYGKREIKVRVLGKNKKELLTVVSYELDEIHASYKRLKFNKLIPCNCGKCKNSQDSHFYSLDVLEQFVDDRQEAIQCQRSYEMVDVRELIDDVIERWGLRATDKFVPTIRDQVFISYSHVDREWLDKLQVMLKPLIRMRKISLWADNAIQAGAKWKTEIEQALASAKVALLLVTPSFLASDFIAEHELPPLLRAAKTEGLTILWVAVSHSMYKETEVANYQAANEPARPLDSLSHSEQNRALVNICEQVIEAALR
jgi:Leucine-rich repeat (LRR) protein